MVEHVNIPNAHIHEPKGASTAPAGTVYQANGLGSGAWVPMPQGQTTPPPAMGSIFSQGRIVDNTAVTVIPAEDVDVKVNFGTGFQTDGIFAGGAINIETDGRINLLGTEDRNFIVTATVSFLPSDSADVYYEFFFMSSGSEKFGSILGSAYIDTSDNPKIECVTLVTGMKLNPGQWVELWVRSRYYGTSLIVQHANITILGIA